MDDWVIELTAVFVTEPTEVVAFPEFVPAPLLVPMDVVGTIEVLVKATVLEVVERDVEEETDVKVDVVEETDPPVEFQKIDSKQGIFLTEI